MKEFIVLMAYLTALVALSIDAVLPAFDTMRDSLGVKHDNSIQLVIGIFFLGMMVGYLIYGQLADAYGRKPILNYGLFIYILGCLLAWASVSLPMLLLGRFIQGLGVASARILTITIVRDKYKGREMAQIMSLVMGIFIFVPVIAPSLGQLILYFSTWRTIFLFLILASSSALLWAHFRLEETLTVKNKKPFSADLLFTGFTEAAKNPVTLGYSITSGFAFAALVGYLSCSQQIFQDLYRVGDYFAVYFGLLAMAVGAAFFTNSALVKRHGMRQLTKIALGIMFFSSLLFLPFSAAPTPPPLLFFMLYAGLCFFCLGLMFGNMGSMALEPMGHMAGLASAFVSFVSTAISIILGTLIGQSYAGSLFPLTLGYIFLSSCAFVILLSVEKRSPS